jgi:hypothetical protein
MTTGSSAIMSGEENIDRHTERPTDVLSCLLSRRRIGAYLDGALDASRARATEVHLRGCGRCQQEEDGLRRLRVLLRRAVVAPADPDWRGFWEGVVRGVEDGRRAAPALTRRRGWRPRVALGGALAVAVLISITLWQMWPVTPEAPVIISSAKTEYPGGTMVYSTADRTVTVVWVFGD